MEKKPKLKIKDDVNGFKLLMLSDIGEEKEIFNDSKNSFTSNLIAASSILGIANLVELIEYGDELFEEFPVDGEQIDKVDFSKINAWLTNKFEIYKKGIIKENFSDEISNEMQSNLIADLAASVFDAAVAQLLVFILNAAQDLNLTEIIFDTELTNIPRFKKLISEELPRYDMTLVE